MTFACKGCVGVRVRFSLTLILAAFRLYGVVVGDLTPILIKRGRGRTLILNSDFGSSRSRRMLLMGKNIRVVEMRRDMGIRKRSRAPTSFT
jgi:hypothetical protein